MSSDQHEIKDAEIGVVGALILKPDLAPDYERVARPEDFHDRRLGIIAGTIYSLSSRPDPVDPVTIAAQLRADGNLQKVGGEGFLIDVATSVTTSAYLGSHAKLVRRAATMREARELCGEALREADSTSLVGDKPVQAFLDDLEARVFSLGHQSLGGAEGGTVDDVVRAAFMGAGRDVTSFRSGYHDLDDLAVDFRPSEFTVIGARPGVGKTTLGLNILGRQCADGARAMIVSLEMSLNQLGQRLLAERGEVNTYNLRSGVLSSSQRAALADAADQMAAWRLSMYEDHGATVGRIASLARRAHRQLGGLDVLMVDYLQLMRDPQGAKNGRTEEVSNISRELKGLARQMDVHVVAICQLSRAGVGRPGLHHLKESGSIEQDADRVLLLWEPEGNDKTVLHCSLEKNRHGATGTFDLEYQREFSKLRNPINVDSETIPFDPDEFSESGGDS